MYFKSGAVAAPRPSSAMSPPGIPWRCSPAIASASPTAFNGGAVFAWGQQERRASRPPEAAATVVKTGRNAGVLFQALTSGQPPGAY